jgi:hypothetical protein
MMDLVSGVGVTAAIAVGSQRRTVSYETYNRAMTHKFTGEKER